MSGRAKLFGALYQVAGELLLTEGARDGCALTKGQRERLTELLLNVLSEPDRYNAAAVRVQHRLAKVA